MAEVTCGGWGCAKRPARWPSSACCAIWRSYLTISWMMAFSWLLNTPELRSCCTLCRRMEFFLPAGGRGVSAAGACCLPRRVCVLQCTASAWERFLHAASRCVCCIHEAVSSTCCVQEARTISSKHAGICTCSVHPVHTEHLQSHGSTEFCTVYSKQVSDTCHR